MTTSASEPEHIEPQRSARLQGRTAWITGSTSGIGAAVAETLAAAGAHVLISGRDAARAEPVAARVRDGGGRADVLAVDLAAAPDELRAAAAEAVGRLGGTLDVLVNNAGIYPVTPTAVLPDADLDAMLAVNIRAAHVLVGVLAPAMAARGGGSIVNVGSWMGSVGHPFGAMYTATKAALEQLSRSWAAEYGLRGVRVNAVAPGVTHTPGNHEHLETLVAMTAATPAGRPMRAQDIAEGVLYLVSDAAAGVHGEVLRIDGGVLTTWRA